VVNLHPPTFGLALCCIKLHTLFELHNGLCVEHGKSGCVQLGLWVEKNDCMSFDSCACRFLHADSLPFITHWLHVYGGQGSVVPPSMHLHASSVGQNLSVATEDSSAALDISNQRVYCVSTCLRYAARHSGLSLQFPS